MSNIRTEAPGGAGMPTTGLGADPGMGGVAPILRMRQPSDDGAS